MANEIPQYKESQPILSPVKIQSEASGFEEFAKTLGALSQSSATQAEEIVSEQSNAMFMKSVSQMQTEKVNSQIEMIKHPDRAAGIADQSASLMENITKNSFVNSQDRRKLQSIASDNFNDIRLKSAEVSYSQSKKDLSISYWNNYPVINKDIQDALDSGDFKKAKILEEAFHKASLNAAQIGAITPEQYASVRKASYDLYSRTEDMLKSISNPEGHTAEQYHAMASSPFNNGNFNNVGFPVNTNTQYIASSYNFDRSMDGQYSNLYNDKPISFGVVMQGTDHEYTDFKEQMIGVNQVKSAFFSGMPFSQIDGRMTTLEVEPKLSPLQTGMVKYWKSLKNRLNTGNGYLNLMSQTTLGGQYTQEYNQTATSIKNSSQTDIEKFNAIRDNDNNYIGNMISLGHAQTRIPFKRPEFGEIDQGFIRPIPGQWVNEVQSAFIKDAHVGNAISRISYIKPEYRPYLADSMEKPNQAIAVYLAGLEYNNLDKTFQTELIEANQNRDYSSLLKTEENESKDSNIWDDLSSDNSIKTLYQYFGKLPGGSNTQTGLHDAAINYVLYRAAKEGDVNLNGKVKYEQDFINNVKKGFNIIEGNRYVFNGSSLNLRKVDMDFIADYALSEAYRNIHQGRSEEEFQTYVDLNLLHATNTPDGRIVVIDKVGHVAIDIDGRAAFDHPYTSDMLSYSHKNAEENIKYMHQYFGITENIERVQRLNPGFPFSLNTPEESEQTPAFMKKTLKKGLRKIKGIFSSSDNEV